jgi:hypothetical protein
MRALEVMIRRIALTTLALALGCEVKNVGDLDTSNVSETNGTESSGGEESSSGDSMTSVSTDPTVGESEESGSESSDTDGCGISMCGAHEDQDVSFVMDGGSESPDTDLIDVPCTVTEDGDVSPLTLECIEDGATVTHTIDEINLSDYALANLGEGREVLFSWTRMFQPYWQEHYFTIRSTEGEILLAGSRGTRLTPAQDFYDPIDPVELVPMCGTECANNCFQWVRTAIEFQTALGSEIVLDGNANIVEDESDYFIRVGTSESRFDFMCSDTPEIWHEWVVERVTVIP